MPSNVHRLSWPMIAVAVISVAAIASPAHSQSLSNSLAGVTVPPPPPAGVPCLGVGLSVDGDIFEPGSPYSVPMGPPGCGLGWPVAGGPPFNVDAFSTGLSAAVGTPFPWPAGSFSLFFATSDLATGDPGTTCTPSIPGPFTVTDVGAEAGDIGIGGTSDVGADIFATGGNGAPWGSPAAPAPGSTPNFQVADGNGVPSVPFGLGTAPTVLGWVEPGPFTDSTDAFDAAPIAAWDPVGADAVPDIPVYFSVDAASAAAVGLAFGPPVGGSDVFVTAGGFPGIYAPAAALGMGPGDDVDALIVLDLLGDGVYAPGDMILYSVTPGSGAVGAPDCVGIVIQEGDILTEGTPFLAPGIPCIVIPQEDIGLWSARACGANPVSGGSDDMAGADLTPALATPATTTSTTTTSTTTTTLPVLCGGSPLVGCRTALTGKSQIQVKLHASDPAKHKLKFKYNKGEATTTGEFADPVGGSAEYRLCLWDSSVNPQPLLEAAVTPGGTCGTKPCWKATGTKGFKFKDKTQTPDGIDQVKLKEGAADKSQVQVKMKGTNFAAPTLPLTTTVTGQFIIEDGGTLCFEVPVSVTIKNDASQFKGKGD